MTDSLLQLHEVCQGLAGRRSRPRENVSLGTTSQTSRISNTHSPSTETVRVQNFWFRALLWYTCFICTFTHARALIKDLCDFVVKLQLHELYYLEDSGHHCNQPVDYLKGI